MVQSESTIRKYRKISGISVSELARRTGVTTTAASNWDHGTSFPRSEALARVAEAIGVTPQDLMAVRTDSRPQLSDDSVGGILQVTKARLAQLVGVTEDAVRLEFRIEV